MRLIRKYLLYFIFITLLSGCSYKYNIESEFSPPNNTSGKYPLDVVLILDSNYSAYTNSTSLAMGTFTFKLGPTLCDNSKILVNTTFEQVTISSKIEEAKKSPFQLLVIPKVVDSSTLFDESHFVMRVHTSIVVEWTFLDEQGKVIYLTTAEGSGSVEAKFLIAWEKAIDDLFNNLYEEIISSQELKAFADKN